MLRIVVLVAIVAVTVGIIPVQAAGSSASLPAGYAPDPALRTASKRDLETRVRRACTSTQARAQGTSTREIERPCGCYASRVMRTLDDGEVAAYRATGAFNEAARAKALAALDSCRLQRPV